MDLLQISSPGFYRKPGEIGKSSLACGSVRLYTENELMPDTPWVERELRWKPLIPITLSDYRMPGNVDGSIGGNSVWSPMKIAAFGVLLLLGACWFWWHEAGNPLVELALIRNGLAAPGLITDAWEDVEEDDKGGDHWFHSVVYTYRLADGREFTGKVHGRGRLRDDIARYTSLNRTYPITVEYLPPDPSVSRIKGSGCQSYVEWLWRKMGVGLILLALFCSPGVYLILHAVRDARFLLMSRQQPCAPNSQEPPTKEDS
ncbi:MAG: DUF3592 domain-containing protein [Phycisphaerales bacterium]